jgi:hypothetical protein
MLDWFPKRIRKSTKRKSPVQPDVTAEFHFFSGWLYFAIAALLVGGVVWIWLSVTARVIAIFPDHGGLEEAARLGDAFGVVNSLFSALAFLGIIATILLQRQELQLQREELEATREELRKSAEAQEKSQAALREQVEWQSLAAYLQALLVIRDISEDDRPFIDRLLKGIAKSAVPEIVKNTLRFMDAETRELLTKRRQVTADTLTRVISDLRQYSANRDTKPDVEGDVCNYIKKAYLLVDRNVPERHEQHGDAGYAYLPIAMGTLVILSDHPISTPSDSQERDEFWRRLDKCIKDLELAVKLLTDTSDEPSNA